MNFGAVPWEWYWELLLQFGGLFEATAPWGAVAVVFIAIILEKN